MNTKLKIGIVGVGNIADIHAQALNESSNAELASVYSRNENNVRNFGEKYNISWYTDWESFISDKNLDVVSICSPNGTHLDYGKKAAEAKKHVVVEKPIEVTIKRAQQLIDACEKNDVKLAVIYQSRFLDSISDLKKQFDQNKLGKLFMGDAYIKWFRSQEYYDSGAWRGTIALDGGGVLINQAIHTVDLLQWLMGDVETIFAQTGTFTHELEGEDNAVAVLRFKNGAIGVIEASTSVQPAQPRRIEIHGENGSAIINGDDVEISIVSESEEKDNTTDENVHSAGASSPFSGFSIEPHKDQFEAIAEAIKNNETPPVSGKNSIKSLAIVLAIYESSKTSVNINLEEFIHNFSFDKSHADRKP